MLIMSFKLQFLQTHCLIMKLVLSHGPSTASNELLWNNHIISELSKICKVIYAKPTFTKLENTFTNRDARIDLVLSSNCTDRLSTVLFNIKGITMKKPPKIRTDLMCPGLKDIFALEHSNEDLEELHGLLLRKWNRSKPSASYIASEQPVIIKPWIFNNRPVKKVVTSGNLLVALNAPNIMKRQYDLSDHRGSRFFQEGPLTKLHDHTASIYHSSGPISSEGYLKVKPVIYESLDSMPPRLQKWLHGAIDDTVKINQHEQERLDLMLHGFKGFA